MQICAVLRLSCSLVEIADPNLPQLCLAPPFGVISLEFHGDFWQQKTRVPGLLYGIVSVIVVLAIFVQCIHRQVLSSYVYSFGSYRVDKHIHKQTDATENIQRSLLRYDIG